MRSSFVPKSQPKVTEMSALEVYYFKVSTKESLSSCKKKIDSLFVLTLKYTVRKSFPESNAFQYSERTMATIETNDTSAKSP